MSVNFTVTETVGSSAALDPQLRTLGAYADRLDKAGVLRDLHVDKVNGDFRVTVEFTFSRRKYRFDDLGETALMIELVLAARGAKA